jgi:hypothetical protein
MLKFLVLLAVLVSIVSAEVRNELILDGDEKIGQVIKTKVHYKKLSELPTHFDYREKGLLTTDLNQHIPTYW